MKNLVTESNGIKIDSIPNISMQAPRGIFGSLLLIEKIFVVIFHPFNANVKMAKELVGLLVRASDRFKIQLAAQRYFQCIFTAFYSVFSVSLLC